MAKYLREAGISMKTRPDRKAVLAERVRNLILDMIHHSAEQPSLKYSEYISKILGINYTHLSKSFSKIWGMTIEQFIIGERIEEVKKLLSSQEDLTLTQIAWRLRYSSTAHLSAQFKKITGITPSHFRKKVLGGAG